MIAEQANPGVYMADEQSTDAYYDDDTGADEELDLSFLDENEDEK